MSISSIFSQAASSASTSTNPFQLATAASSSGDGVSATDSAQISQPGQLFSQLQQLATSDPTKFKQVTSQIATQLQQDAQQQGGQAGTFLNSIAAKFQQASQTGDASALAPAHHHGGGHHHHGGEGGAQPTSAASSPAQTASSAYAAQSQNPFDEVTSVIENALSNSASATTTAAAG